MTEKRTGLPIEQFGPEPKRWGMPADTPETIDMQYEADLAAVQAESDENDNENSTDEQGE